MGNDEVAVLPPLSKMATAQVWPIVQSLAELVHHAPTVVDMLLALLDDPAVVAQVTEFDLSVSFRALCLRRVTEFGGGGGFSGTVAGYTFMRLVPVHMPCELRGIIDCPRLSNVAQIWY